MDELPETSVEAGGALLRRAVEDPELARLLAAPVDDEPYSEDERQEDAAAVARLERGEGVEWPEAKKRLRAG